MYEGLDLEGKEINHLVFFVPTEVDSQWELSNARRSLGAFNL